MSSAKTFRHHFFWLDGDETVNTDTHTNHRQQNQNPFDWTCFNDHGQVALAGGWGWASSAAKGSKQTVSSRSGRRLASIGASFPNMMIECEHCWRKPQSGIPLKRPESRPPPRIRQSRWDHPPNTVHHRTPR